MRGSVKVEEGGRVLWMRGRKGRRVDKESGNKRVLCKRRKEREKADSNLVSNVVLPEPQDDAGLGC